MPPEFRRKVLDLLKAGRTVAQIAHDLQISEQTIYTWRRQERIAARQEPGLTSAENAELAAARSLHNACGHTPPAGYEATYDCEHQPIPAGALN